MKDPLNLLLVLALVAFIIAAVNRPADHPLSSIRCIALGLALFTLRLLIQWL